jgi:hypothetical protein
MFPKKNLAPAAAVSELFFLAYLHYRIASDNFRSIAM